MCDRRTTRPTTEVTPRNPHAESQKNKDVWNCVMCGKGDTRTNNLRRHMRVGEVGEHKIAQFVAI